MAQQTLANVAGIAPAQLSRYEAGKAQPRPVLVGHLAQVLGVSFEWLMEGKGKPEPVPPFPKGAERARMSKGRGHTVVLSADLADALREQALLNNWSLDSEVAVRLRRSLAQSAEEPTKLRDVYDRLGKIEDMIVRANDSFSETPGPYRVVKKAAERQIYSEVPAVSALPADEPGAQDGIRRLGAGTSSGGRTAADYEVAEKELRTKGPDGRTRTIAVTVRSKPPKPP